MTRRKSVCLKWTLVLLVVLVCPSVYSRPQEELSVTPTIKAQNEKCTVPPIRYTFSNLSLNSFKLAPKVISFVNETNEDISNNRIGKVSFNANGTKETHASNPFSNISNRQVKTSNVSNRTGRLIRANSHERKKKHKPKPVKNRSEEKSHDRKKPAIRNVIIKWRDKTKLNDLNFSYETSTSESSVKDTTKLSSVLPNDDTITESSSEINSKRYSRPPHDMYNDPYYSDNNMYNNQRPQYSYSDESQAYSPNIQVINTRPRPTRPPYYHTNIPTPTPIITNLGYPKPWTLQVTRKSTTHRPNYNTRPTNYEYHNNVPNYIGGNTYEVSTFEPVNSYTDRIVIRPEEYSPSAEDCPTIYLTLNNTFQGQAKEACPDLNIAVNTNVINKNVVIESEEEESESLFTGGFGLGLGDDSGADLSKDKDYFDSDENQEQDDESASVEGTELTNYHSENSVIKPESDEVGGLEWRWDDDLKTWHLHSFPNNRRLVPGEERANTDSNQKGGIKPTLFFKLKEWMKNMTNSLKQDQSRHIVFNGRKTKRKKREAWTRRLMIN